MKLIDTKEYEGFKTEFYILPKTEEFIVNKKINIKDQLLDTFHFYEHVLFDMLDSGDGRSEENEKRRNFKVVFYGIIEKWVDKQPQGFIEQFVCDKSKILNDSFIVLQTGNIVDRFGVREIILVQ